MKKHNGGLGNFLNEITQTSEKNSQEEKIIYLEIDELEENPKNFYGLRDVDALAGLISVSKLIEPLTVIKNFDGKYKIISGHRRHAVIKKLISEGNFDGKIPCIVKNLEKISIEQENGETIEFDEDAVEMLNLIASNRGQRGRFRNFFAEEILNISKSQLQRIKSMEKLTAQVKSALDAKRISETSAMEMANLTAEEWLEEVIKDFYKKLYEVAKNISRAEKDKIKSAEWKERASLLRKNLNEVVSIIGKFFLKSFCVYRNYFLRE